MIFSNGLHELVLDGRKTQTRRPVTAPECRYTVGKTYAVQPGRTEKSVGRITVSAVRQEFVTSISRDDAWREGFATVADFARVWVILHGDYAERYMATRLADDEAIALFRRSFADQQVWVITFERARDGR